MLIGQVLVLLSSFAGTARLPLILLAYIRLSWLLCLGRYKVLSVLFPFLTLRYVTSGHSVYETFWLL